MVATKMFWDMWRNLTNATSNWTITSSSSQSSSSSLVKNKSSRYNRLRSQPTKSLSQPANLAGLGETTSLESLADDVDIGSSMEGERRQKCEENINVGRGAINPKKSTIKHSFTTASFLPFSTNECSSKSTKAVDTKEFPSGIDCNKSSSKTPSRIQSSDDNSIEKNSSLGETTLNSTTTQTNRRKEEFCVVEHVISDVDDDDDDAWDQLTCDVCDRAFSTFRQLAEHQRKKRHYGCLQCDTMFPTRESLDIHREQMCHYEYAIDLAGFRNYRARDDDDTDSFVTDSDENGFGYSDDGDDEEMERLL